MLITKLLKGAAIVSIAATIPFVASAEWTPKKPIDFVIMAGKGGGADKMARLMQSVITKNKMSPRLCVHALPCPDVLLDARIRFCCRCRRFLWWQRRHRASPTTAPRSASP